MTEITRICITGLNGRTNVKLPFTNGHCIIVGPNGSGKSIALQIISLALGRQWKQLATQRFDTITIEFGGESATISRTACGSISQTTAGPSRFGRVYRRLLEIDELEGFATADLTNSMVADRYQVLAGLPLSELRTAQRHARMQHVDKSSQAQLTAFQKALDAHQVPKTLYLPTSRRIEFDLGRFADRLPDYMRRDFTDGLKKSSRTENFEEVLRFGMDDIQTMIAEFEKKTRDYSRNRFNKMMSSYLKEMANSQSISINDLRSFKIDQNRVDEVLSRIEEGILSSDEKTEIGNIVVSLAKPQKGAGSPPFHKRWLAHFFVRLLEVDADIASLELPIRDLVRDLQKYLAPKSVSYDIESYHFSITDNYGDEIKLGELSSGEKQLVSLLTILQLSDSKSMNVFIDEPELSLSVPWQSDFLTDIVAARSCNQLIAVTHSPFTYENSLGTSVVDFVECAGE